MKQDTVFRILKKSLEKNVEVSSSEPEEAKGDLWQKKQTKSTKIVYL